MKAPQLIKTVLIIIAILFNTNLFSQVQYEASIKNQTVVIADPTYGNCIYFDIYLRQNGGPGPLYLADADFKFTFNAVNFSTPTIKYIAGSTILHNSLGALTTFYNGNISAAFSSPNKLNIHVQGLNIISQSQFDHQVAKINGAPSYHKVGKFVVYTIANLTGTFGLTWKTGPGGTVVMSMHPSCPWSTCQATGTFPEITEPILPIELTSFTGNVVNKRDVTLNWNTATETNNKGFEIERRNSGTAETWAQVGYINGKGTTTPASYDFTDRKLNTGKYNYRLKQIDYNGNFEYYNLNGIVEIGTPGKFGISQNYPNPFNPTTKIDFDLPFDSKVTLKLYDISGREVMTLVNEDRTTGYYTETFNMSNISSGAYFYRINANGGGQNYVMTKKMLMIK